MPDLVVVSNRGPLNFALDGDDLITKKAAGGLVNALVPALHGRDVLWIAGAITEADRRAAAGGPLRLDPPAVAGEERTSTIDIRLLSIDPTAYRSYYDGIANSTLWYLNHGLFDGPRRPQFDRRWREAWQHFRDVNARFADAIVELAPEGATVLVQDYHLSLVGGLVAERRHDLALVHFNHTPFCTPQELRMLPDDCAEELLRGLAGFRSCGFHTRRWASQFEACCAEVLGVVPPTFVAPAAPDLADVIDVAATESCDRHLAGLTDAAGSRKMIVRVDRIELSKNLLRGFLAFDELLETRPEWQGQVVFAAFVYPSRQTLPDYLGYAAEVTSLIGRLNAKWSTPEWTPILLDETDNFPASVAGLRAYDVLLVNPVRDGLNLVAKEGVVVNERDGVLALSRESGVADELGEWSVVCNPFDISATADALHRALAMPAAERAERAAGMRTAVEKRTPDDWLADLLTAAAPLPN